MYDKSKVTIWEKINRCWSSCGRKPERRKFSIVKHTHFTEIHLAPNDEGGYFIKSISFKAYLDKPLWTLKDLNAILSKVEYKIETEDGKMLAINLFAKQAGAQPPAEESDPLRQTHTFDGRIQKILKFFRSGDKG